VVKCTGRYHRLSYKRVFFKICYSEVHVLLSLFWTKLTCAVYPQNLNGWHFAARQRHVQPLRVFTYLLELTRTGRWKGILPPTSLLEPHVIPTTKQNITDKKYRFQLRQVVRTALSPKYRFFDPSKIHFEQQ